MKTWKSFTAWLRGGCVYFTAIALVMLLLNIMLQDSGSQFAISPTSFLLIFPMGLTLSLAELLYKLPSMPRWGGALLHYGLSLFSFLLFLWLPLNSTASPAATFVLFTALSVLYWIAYFLVHLIRGRIRRLMDEN